MIKHRQAAYHIQAEFNCPLINLSVGVFIDRSPSFKFMKEVLTYLIMDINTHLEKEFITPFEAGLWRQFKEELYKIYSQLASNGKLLRDYKNSHTTVKVTPISIKGFVK